MKQPKLLLVTEYFWPDRASTGYLLSGLMACLKKHYGHWIIDALTSRRLYRGSSNKVLPKAEIWQGIRIKRLPSFRSGRDSMLRRAFSDLFFSIQAAIHVITSDHDIIILVTNPPLMPLLVTLLSGIRRRRILYIIHDLYPDVPIALGLWSKNNIFVRFIAKLQRFALQKAQRVIVLGRCMQEYLVNVYRIKPEKIEVIPNWATFSVEEQPPSYSERLKLGTTFNVVYSGNLGQFQDFHTILEGAELLRSKPFVRFFIIGDGARTSWLHSEVSRRGLSNITFHPFLDDIEFRQMLLEKTHLGLVTLEPNLEGLGVPSKTYNLLAMGVPLLAILGPHSEIAKIIIEHQLGYRVDHGDAESLVRCILDAYNNSEKWAEMSRRAFAYSRNEAVLERAAHQYAEILKSAIP
ncbi:MAG: glycosyltransferase family 4 protein [Firmicutes bacterium]|nr:glycosyltransferase family 4 protein [Bacillota bacterium]